MLALACAACGAAPQAKPSSAAVAPLERDHLKLTYATAGGAQTFARIAADQGFFQKYGLTVDVQYAQSNISMAALTAGQVDLDVTAGPDVIQAVASGVPVRIIGYFNKRGLYAVFAAADIRQPSDLKGKSMAIGKIGDTSDIALRMALKPFGIDANRDLRLLQVGNSPDRWAALSSGQVQAAIIDEDSYTKLAKAQGFNVLISMRELPYAAGVLAAKDDFLKANPNSTLAALRGLVDGVKFYVDDKNKTETLAAIGRELKMEPTQQQVLDVWQAASARTVTDPYPEADGVRTILEALKELDPGRYGSLTTAQVIDPSFAEKLRAI